MKIIKTASGNKFRLDEKSWNNIGKKANWFKKAQNIDFDSIDYSGLGVRELVGSYRQGGEVGVLGTLYSNPEFYNSIDDELANVLGIDINSKEVRNTVVMGWELKFGLAKRNNATQDYLISLFNQIPDFAKNKIIQTYNFDPNKTEKKILSRNNLNKKANLDLLEKAEEIKYNSMTLKNNVLKIKNKKDYYLNASIIINELNNILLSIDKEIKNIKNGFTNKNNIDMLEKKYNMVYFSLENIRR